MLTFKRNVDFLPYKPMSRWRKLAVSTWRNSEEASFYGWIDYDAAGIRKVINEFHRQGHRISPTAIAAKGVAKAISAYPKLNSVIRFGRIYQRKSIDVFFQVAPDDTGDTLTGICIRQCDKKTLSEIHDEIRERVKRIRKGEDDFIGFGTIMQYVPSFIIGWFQAMVSFFVYQLNIWSPLFGIPQDAFGSAMVTSVGMLGLQRGLAPLMPYVQCPMIVTIGKLEQKVLVQDGEIVIKEVIPICATMDHRLIDGVGAAKLMHALKTYFENPS